MTSILLIVAAVGLVVSVLLGWKLRSWLVPFVGCVATLFAIALLPPGGEKVAVVAKGEKDRVERSAPTQPDAATRSDGPQEVTERETGKADKVPTGKISVASGLATPPAAPFEAPADVSLASLKEQRPIEVTTRGYVGSDACLECHPDNHATWDASYHSTMTQVADPEIVMGNFNDVRVVCQGRDYFLTKTDEVCYVDMPDEQDPTKRIRAPIVMTTGSHHMQVYWFATGNKRSIGMLPIVYLKESGEWIPRHAAFLVPPNQPPSFEMSRWNNACSSCHSTHRKGRRLATGEWDTHVGEFGISCEACHGPGEDHIEYQRSFSESDGSETKASDPIVNPAHLDKLASAQVCGQCHSVSDLLHMDLEYQEHGHDYRPGMDLYETHGVWRRESPEHELTRVKLEYPDLDTLLDETYYPDGMIRVSGREFNGLIESKCFTDGEMTCLSCHQMHKANADPRSVSEWADDQLDVNAIGNQACTQCHQAEQYGTSHTHHAADSLGSNCYNCHMPHTTYGLLKAIRSHKISSPDVAKDRANKRPNACNLCHLDRTLEWSAGHLEQWYGTEPPELEAEEKEIAASLIWLLKGDAAERAIAAWHMGWKDAQQTSGDDWQLPFLTALLDDDYEAIRLIARRSIQSLPEMDDFDLDVVAASTSSERERRGFEALGKWFKQEATQSIDRPELLIRDGGVILVDRLRGLIDQRDNRRIYLSE